MTFDTKDNEKPLGNIDIMDKRSLSSMLINKALEFGACSAGIANIKDLKKMPSFVVTPKRPHVERVGAVSNETGLPEGVVAWPDGMKSVLVIAYLHPQEDQYLDCWLDWKNPPGNEKLANIIRKIKTWLEKDASYVTAIPMNYYVEKGGVWLKDSAAVAGIGVIGRNNMLVTPRFGPRVRLRAMYLSEDLSSTGPIEWDPCKGCSMPCRSSCPQKAFENVIYNPADYDGETRLPGRNGCYSLVECDKQMAIDEANEQKGEIEIPGYGIYNSVLTYCRKCELSCPVGK